MQAIFENLKSICRDMNKISKYYIKYGNIIVFTAYVLALFCTVSMGRMGDFDRLLYLRGELLMLGKEMAGAVYIPAIMLEILNIAKKCDKIN